MKNLQPWQSQGTPYSTGPGDQGDEIEEQEELDEETDKQEQVFSDNHDEDEEEETTSVYTTVKDNETPKSVAKKFGCSAADIVRLNEPKDGTRMFQTSKYKIGSGVNVPQ